MSVSYNRIRKGIPCSIQVWNGCDLLYSESGHYFENISDVERFVKHNFKKYKGEMIEYKIYQNDMMGNITSIESGCEIK